MGNIKSISPFILAACIHFIRFSVFHSVNFEMCKSGISLHTWCKHFGFRCCHYLWINVWGQCQFSYQHHWAATATIAQMHIWQKEEMRYNAGGVCLKRDCFQSSGLLFEWSAAFVSVLCVHELFICYLEPLAPYHSLFVYHYYYSGVFISRFLAAMWHSLQVLDSYIDEAGPRALG